MAGGKRLPNIEYAKKYKTQRQIFPVERTESEKKCEKLARDFVDDYELRIILAGELCHTICGGNAEECQYEGDHDPDRPFWPKDKVDIVQIDIYRRLGRRF